MINKSEAVSILKEGGIIIRDCVLGIDTVRVVCGTYVRKLSLDIFKKMKLKEQIVMKEIIGLCSVYKLAEKKK